MNKRNEGSYEYILYLNFKNVKRLILNRKITIVLSYYHVYLVVAIKFEEESNS